MTNQRDLFVGYKSIMSVSIEIGIAEKAFTVAKRNVQILIYLVGQKSTLTSNKIFIFSNLYTRLSLSVLLIKVACKLCPRTINVQCFRHRDLC